MTNVININIPHDPKSPDGCWVPRDYQRDVWHYLQEGGKRAIEIWHRRSGKDELALAWTCRAMMERVGVYWHMLPEAAQVRKAIWDAVDPHRGIKRIDIAFPKALRRVTRTTDMYIEAVNGSSWQAIGSDNYDSLVGSPPVGIVFSEWALANPYAWAYLKPILEENSGWALFITTSRGPNHAKRMFDHAMSNDDWHAEILTARDTGLFDDKSLERIKTEYASEFGDIVGEAMFEQEYMCSFEAAILGAVYGTEMTEARNDGRITSVPHDPAHQVETWWDLGYRDATAIWFVQRVGTQLRAIDYYENTQAGIDHYAKVLQDKGYVYSQHHVPHDASKGEVGSIGGLSLIQQASKLGLRLKRTPQTPLFPGINATRAMLARMVFDSRRCEHGIDAIVNYHHAWDERKKTLTPYPVHDWSSHGADALRTGAMAEATASLTGAPARRPRLGGSKGINRA